LSAGGTIAAWPSVAAFDEAASADAMTAFTR
jgi:hypothetical protein